MRLGRDDVVLFVDVVIFGLVVLGIIVFGLVQLRSVELGIDEQDELLARVSGRSVLRATRGM